MKNSKKIFIVAMSIIMIIATVTCAYADYATVDTYLSMTPSDLGSLLSAWYGAQVDNVLTKIYIKIDLTQTPQVMQYQYINNDNEWAYTTFEFYTYENNVFTLNDINISSNYSFIAIPYINETISNGITEIYIPAYIYNCSPFRSGNTNCYYIYRSTINDENVIKTEYFNLGYTNGYNTGYTNGVIDSADIQHNLNLVEHCEQLLGTFVGEDYAHYITPLCLALVVILIYFLFIRWLLALVKSKNVTRVADIIVCTACIIMLVIMYAPMLDLTIKQAQTVYQIAADTVVGG